MRAVGARRAGSRTITISRHRCGSRPGRARPVPPPGLGGAQRPERHCRKVETAATSTRAIERGTALLLGRAMSLPVLVGEWLGPRHPRWHGAHLPSSSPCPVRASGRPEALSPSLSASATAQSTPFPLNRAYLAGRGPFPAGMGPFREVRSTRRAPPPATATRSRALAKSPPDRLRRHRLSLGQAAAVVRLRRTVRRRTKSDAQVTAGIGRSERLSVAPRGSFSVKGALGGEAARW
jgi:hypothetical protein